MYPSCVKMPTQNLLRLYTVTDIDAETHVSDSLSASKQKVQVEKVNQICRSRGTGMHTPPRPGPGENGCPWAPRPENLFQSYACFRKGTRPTRQKVFPHPTMRAPVHHLHLTALVLSSGLCASRAGWINPDCGVFRWNFQIGKVPLSLTYTFILEYSESDAMSWSHIISFQIQNLCARLGFVFICFGKCWQKLTTVLATFRPLSFSFGKEFLNPPYEYSKIQKGHPNADGVFE